MLGYSVGSVVGEWHCSGCFWGQRTALAEPDRHVAIRFLASALEGDPGDQPGLRNKGLLATHELLHGVPECRDWGDATERSGPLLGLRGQDLVRGLGYEIKRRQQHNVLRASSGRVARNWLLRFRLQEQRLRKLDLKPEVEKHANS